MRLLYVRELLRGRAVKGSVMTGFSSRFLFRGALLCAGVVVSTGTSSVASVGALPGSTSVQAPSGTTGVLLADMDEMGSGGMGSKQDQKGMDGMGSGGNGGNPAQDHSAHSHGGGAQPNTQPSAGAKGHDMQGHMDHMDHMDHMHQPSDGAKGGSQGDSKPSGDM